MVRLLFALVFLEMGLIIVLLFGSPLRKGLIMVLDRVKRGRGPLVAKTVAGTVSVLLVSTLYSIFKINKRSSHGMAVDQLVFAKYLLEASLMGTSLFLAGMLDRLHYYVKEVGMLRKSLEMRTI